jgi:hypothetical protein
VLTSPLHSEDLTSPVSIFIVHVHIGLLLFQDVLLEVLGLGLWPPQLDHCLVLSHFTVEDQELLLVIDVSL